MFKFDENAWIHVSPLGEFEHSGAGVVQVIDSEAVSAIVEDFKTKASAENFPGLLMDFDHFSMDTDKSSEAAGWIFDLRADDSGLWAKVRWSSKGADSVKGGDYRLVSPVFPKASECEDLGGGRVRPRSLVTVALTNDPNIKGAKPLTNRASGKVGNYEFSSTQLNLPKDIASTFLDRFQAHIDPKDVHEEGRELEPHVTVQYGLHDSDSEAVAKAVTSCRPVPIVFSKAEIFNVPEKGFEVLVYAVEKTPELLALRKAVSGSGKTTETFPTYQPYVTIAYLKPGSGERYLKDIGSLDPLQSCIVDELKFSSKSGKSTIIQLSGGSPQEKPTANRWSDRARMAALVARRAKNEARKLAAQAKLKEIDDARRAARFVLKPLVPLSELTKDVKKKPFFGFKASTAVPKSRYYHDGAWYDNSGAFVSRIKPARKLANRSGGKETQYKWVLGKTKTGKHCEGCQARAGKVKTAAEWKAMGKTACGSQCKCKLVPVKSGG